MNYQKNLLIRIHHTYPDAVLEKGESLKATFAGRPGYMIMVTGDGETPIKDLELKTIILNSDNSTFSNELKKEMARNYE